MVSEDCNDKVRDTINNGKDKGKFKLKGEIKYYYSDNAGHIIKHYNKLAEDKKNAKDKE